MIRHALRPDSLALPAETLPLAASWRGSAIPGNAYTANHILIASFAAIS